MTARQPAGSIFDFRPSRRAEREFAGRVEAAFQADDAAIALVRASILAQVPAPTVVAAPTTSRRPTRSFTMRLAPLAIVLVVVAASGFAIIRSLSATSSLGTAPGGTAQSPSASGAPADLDQADVSLQLVLTAVRAGDATDLNVVLADYQTRLAAIAIEVRRPGTDLAAARARLLTEESSLSAVASAVSPADAPLFDQVRGDLAAIIASLPGKATPPAAHPSAGHSSGAPGTAPTSKPGSPNPPANGKTNGSSNGNGNAAGNGNGNAAGNGNGNAAGNGNGNAAGNGNSNAGGNGKGNAGGNGNGNAGGNGNGKGKGN